MPILRYLTISLASALVAAYAALWYASPAPIEQSHVVTVPSLTVQEHQGDLLIWGSWKTVAGYEQPGKNAIEIRCNATKTTCSEAYANLMHHDEGEDIEAQVFNYEVVEWTESLLHAVAKGAHAGDAQSALQAITLFAQRHARGGGGFMHHLGPRG